VADVDVVIVVSSRWVFEVLTVAAYRNHRAATMPLLPFTNGEKSYFGSFLGNYDDLAEVLALASEGLIKHTVPPVTLDDVNDNLTALARGDIVGRAVIVFN
jgi:propanol-preferring alcohol dehydrogenase